MPRKISRTAAVGLAYTLVFSLILAYSFLHDGLFFRPIQLTVSTVILGLVLVGAIAMNFLRKLSHPHWLLFAYMLTAYALLTTLWGANPELAVSGVVVLTAAVGLAMFVPALNLTWRQVLLVIIGASGPALYLFAAAAALGWVHYTNAIQTGMMDSVFQYHNTFASYELATALLSISLTLQGRTLLNRVLYSMAASTAIVAIVASSSRMVWLLTPIMLLAAFAGAVYMKRTFTALIAITTIVIVAVAATPFALQMVRHSSVSGALLSLAVLLVGGTLSAVATHYITTVVRRSLRNIFGAALLIVPIVGIAILMVHESSHLTTIVNRVQTIDFKDASVEGRFWYYGAAMRMWTNNLFFGSGPGTWTAKFQAFEQFPYWSTQVHSVFFDQLLNFGILGTGIWITMLTLVVRAAVRSIRQRDEAGHLSLAALLAATSLLLHALLDFDMTFPVMQFTLFVLLALAATGSQDGPPRASHLRALPLYVGFLGVGVLGATLAVSETLLNKAETMRVSSTTQLAMLHRSATFAPYNASTHVALANAYYSQFLQSHSTNDASRTWDETRAAAAYATWDPKTQQGAAVTAYHLGHVQEAFQWAQRSTRDGKYNMTYPSTYMGIALWIGVAEYHNNPQDATSIFQNLVATYKSINQNISSLKRVPKNMAQDWSYAMDMPTQTYVATAEYCLGNYQASINELHYLSKVNQAYDTMGLYEIVSLLDAARLEHKPIDQIPSELTYKDDALTQEFQALSAIGS